MQIAPFKMKVTPDKGINVLKILFKNGYRWVGGRGTETSESYVALRNRISLFSSLETISRFEKLEGFRAFDDHELFPEPEITYDEFMNLYEDIEIYDYSYKNMIDFAKYYLDNINEEKSIEELLKEFVKK